MPSDNPAPGDAAAQTVSVATWNVNSIKVRLDQVTAWLDANRPDLLFMQEIKCEEAAFPAMEFSALGYRCHVVGQKTYNGVAVAALRDVEVRHRALPGDPEDRQARYIEVDCNGLIVAGLYLPNGNPTGPSGDDPKYLYKLAWMDRLVTWTEALLAGDAPFVLCGDFNVIPAPEDCYDANAWRGDALFRPETDRRWRTLLNLGLTDAVRALDRSPDLYSFWDYQRRAWDLDNGIRIDHFLLSPAASDRLMNCRIDRAARGVPKASDHTPVVLTLRNDGRSRP